MNISGLCTKLVPDLFLEVGGWGVVCEICESVVLLLMMMMKVMTMME